ncbi:MAG: hypothetical protein ACREQ5_03640 [Candidatus Dormibacteria bacterium]
MPDEDVQGKGEKERGPEKGQVPKDSTERKREVSALDLADIKENQERLDEEIKKVSTLVVGLVQGMESKVIPMIEAHESVLVQLPQQLEQSFTKQTELMKGYIEKRLGAPIDATTVPQGQQGGQPAKSGVPGKFDLGNLVSFASDQIKQAGGLQNIIGGTKASTATISLDEEFREILTAVQKQTILDVKSLYRQRLGLGPLDTVASGPVVVKAP